MILGCNPDSAQHWINLRLIIDGQAKVYYSGIDDNPTATATTGAPGPRPDRGAARPAGQGPVGVRRGDRA